MEILKTENYVINYDKQLQDFINRTVFHAENKKKEFCSLFECSENVVGVLKASFFTKREEFVGYIKKISGGDTPPSWATGCFYNNEIQVMVDVKNPEQKFNTLAHETLHLFFNKNIYEKYNIDRVNWLDESFAVYLDGNPDDVSGEELSKIINYLDKMSNGFDMIILADYNKVKTQEYNGYDMFNIIGKYIFENHLEKEFLETLKSDRNKIVEIGTHILQDAINYFKNK